ncbi:hypothetical protein ACF0H5_016766 [Mactra antiquata]
MVPLLVSCDWLSEKVKSGDLSNIIILDVSWSSTKDCYEEYKKQHIPGSQYLNIMCGDHTDIYPRNIPTTQQFTDIVQAVGVNTTSHVVVYSSSDRAGYFMAGRGWWTFKYFGHENVSILDGGLQKWLNLNLPVTVTSTECKRGDFVVKINRPIYKSFEDVKANTESKVFQVIDSRTSSAYTDGHIPEAFNLTMVDLINTEDGVLKSEQDIHSLFNNIGIDLSKPIVTHCNSGMSSCTLAFAAMYLGCKNVSVYHGGFTEWNKRQEEK